MGTIPAPDIFHDAQEIAQAPQNAMAEYARVAALKAQTQGQQQQNQQQQQMAPIQQQSAQLDLQQKQLQMQDQQTMRQLAPQFIQKDDSGKVTGFDVNGLAQAASAKGVNPATTQQLLMGYAKARTDLAGATKAERDNQEAANSEATDQLEGLKGVTDPQQRQQAYVQAVQHMQKNGLDVSSFPAVVPQSNDDLSHLEVPLGMHKQLVNEAKTQADTQKATAEAAANAAKAQGENIQVIPELGVKVNKVTNEVTPIAGAVMSPQMMEGKYVALAAKKAAGQPLAPEDAAFMKGVEKYKTLVPTANINMQAGLLSDQAKQMLGQNYQQTGQLPAGIRSPAMSSQILNQAAGPAGAAVPNIAQNKMNYGAETALQKSAVAGEMGKNITAYNTAIAHAGQLSQAADALDNGDVHALNAVGNALGYQFGSDKTTNFNVIKNALSGEISKVFKGGEATDAEIKAVQAPFDAANSPAQLKGAISNAIHLMNSKRDALQQQYQQGMQGKPNFGGSGGMIRARDPQGKLHEAPAGTPLPQGWTPQ